MCRQKKAWQTSESLYILEQHHKSRFAIYSVIIWFVSNVGQIQDIIYSFLTISYWTIKTEDIHSARKREKALGRRRLCLDIC